MATSTTALETIFSAVLSPTEHLLLEAFIKYAVDPELAAQYLLSRVQQGSIETSLRSFKRDWRILTSIRKILRIRKQKIAHITQLVSHSEDG